MYQFSDSDSPDSDEGIRFKTESTRDKTRTPKAASHKSDRSSRQSSDRRRRRSRSRSKSRGRSSRDSSRHRNHRTRDRRDDRTPRKSDKDKRTSDSSSTLAKNRDNSTSKKSNEKKADEKKEIGPVPPPRAEPEPKKDDLTPIGPKLPPHLLQNAKPVPDSKTIGPALPAHLREKLKDQSEKKPVDEKQSLDEDEDYGPLPLDSCSSSKAHQALEERALQIRIDSLAPQETDDTPGREEWMLELPQIKAATLGFTSRQFRAKPGPDLSDRSSWTETPGGVKKPKKSDKSEEIDLKKEAELKEMKRRDREQEEVSKKHRKKKSGDSLVDIHQKMKKKKEEPSERRPFSREIDLQVNKFDESRKNAVMKKAHLLDDRFSSGQSKFL